MMMDHNMVVDKNLVEKYFLGELSADEREAFEDHFFDCSECAADVKTTAVLIDNVREVLFTATEVKKAPSREPRTAGFLSWWKPAYSFAAVAVLLVTVGYQNLVTIPNLRQSSATEPQTLTSYSFVTAGSRGEGGVQISVPTQSPFGIYFDIPGDPSYSSYSAEVVTQAGQTKLSVPVSAEQTKDTVQLLVPGGLLSDGQYDLVIRGYKTGSAANAGQEIIRLPFLLRTK